MLEDTLMLVYFWGKHQVWLPELFCVNPISHFWFKIPIFSIKWVLFTLCLQQNIMDMVQKTTKTHTMRRKIWNLPHKFHLYLITIVISKTISKNGKETKFVHQWNWSSHLELTLNVDAKLQLEYFHWITK